MFSRIGFQEGKPREGAHHTPRRLGGAWQGTPAPRCIIRLRSSLCLLCLVPHAEPSMQQPRDVWDNTNCCQQLGFERNCSKEIGNVIECGMRSTLRCLFCVLSSLCLLTLLASSENGGGSQKRRRPIPDRMTATGRQPCGTPSEQLCNTGLAAGTRITATLLEANLPVTRMVLMDAVDGRC